MATSGGVQVGGALASAKGRIGSLFGKLGSGLGKVADSKAAGWATDKVRSLTVNDQVIKGWQDVYKGVKTLEGQTKIIKTVRIVREPSAAAGRVISGGSRATKSVGNAAKAAKATGGVSKAAATAGKAARGAKTVASGAARRGDVLLREGTKVAGSIKKIKIPGGFKEVTKLDVTKAQLVGKAGKAVKAAKAGKAIRGSEAGLKVVKGTKFKLGSAAEGRVISGGSRAGTASGSGVGRGAQAARSGAGAKGALKGAKGAAGAAKGSRAAARGAKGSRAAARVSETTTTITKGAKGFKKPFGMQAIKAGFKNIFQGAMKAAKVSGIVNLVISVVSNGYGVMSGQIGLPEALGAVARDTASGFVAGGFAAVFSGGVLAVAGAFGLTAGLPIFLLGLGASLIGYIICDAMFNAIIGDKIKSGVQHLFGG